MTTQSLPISRLVNVSVNLTPLAAQSQNLNTLLVLGSSNVIDTEERVRIYNSTDAVAADFNLTSPEYYTAQAYFSQSPQPKQLMVGRWAQAATAARLIGATLSVAQQAIGVFNAITSGALLLQINGIWYAIGGLNFSTATNLNGVASILQTALNTALAGTTVVWNASFSRFEITSPTVGSDSSLSFVNTSAAVGRATFASNPANLDTLTLNGTVVTFVTGVPSGNQVLIGANLAATLDNLFAFLTASVNAELVKFNYSLAGSVLSLKAVATGTAGNSLTLAKTATAITLSGATLTGGAATSIDGVFGATSNSPGSYVAQGVDTETAAECAALMDQRFGQQWYALIIPAATKSQHLSVAAYIESTNNKHIYGITTQDADALVATATSNISYLVSEAGYKKTLVQFSSRSAYAAASLLGRAINVEYGGANTVITLMYKQEPGIAPETLNESQMQALRANNCNVFVSYNNNTNIVEPGVMASGNFIDEITGTDAFAVEVMTDIYNTLYTTPTKIPQTNAGHVLIQTVIEATCSRYVTNGLAAPGVWNSAGFGELEQGDFLPKGFYVYFVPVELQSQARREAREAQPMQVAIKLAGAIHTVDVLVSVNR